MRLAVFTSKYPAQTATFFERDMRALSSAGVELDVFAITPPDEKLWRYVKGEQAGVPRDRVNHLSFGRGLLGARSVLARQTRPALGTAGRALMSAARYGPVTFAKTAYVLPLAWAWSALQAEQRYDHVLGYWGNYAGTCAYMFHRLMRETVPFSLWLHAGVDLYERPAFMRQKLRYADNIVTCCEFNKGYIQRHFGAIVPGIGARVHVSHHGLDLAEFRYQPENRPPHTILAVGRLVTKKGYDYLLRAAQVLQQRGVAFTIDLVGDGEERASLEKLAAQLGVRHRLNFRGWLTPAETRVAMTQGTILVHPSDGLGDGLPNVIREAMALGTPVVASDVAGIPDALADGCGLLVPPKDVRALADALERLLGDAALRASIAARARERVEERYDLFRNGQRLAALLAASQRRESRRPWRFQPARLAPGEVA